MRLLVLCRLLAILLLAGLAPPSAAQGPSEKLLKDRIDAARKTYDGYVRHLKAGGLSLRKCLEPIYLWSRRTLEAEQAFAKGKEKRTEALTAHLKRMSDLEKLAVNLVKTGQAGQAEADSARFFRLEAEIWLAQEKAKR